MRFLLLFLILLTPVFMFSVDNTAPIGEAGTLRFAITPSGAASPAKQVLRLEVEAPREVLLEANYPNPFNPTTTIGYALPADGHVSLRVYDVKVVADFSV